MEEFLVANSFELMAKMFDGCMIYGEHYDKPDILTNMMCCIKEKLDYSIVLTFKSHTHDFDYPEDYIAIPLPPPDKPDVMIEKTFHTWAKDKGYYRLRGTTHVLQKTKPNYAKQRFSTAEETINAFLIDDKYIQSLFIGKVKKGYRDMLTNFMETETPNDDFILVEYNARYYSYSNGIYDLYEDRLIEDLEENVLCINHFDADFKPISERPELIDKIYKDQDWTDETIDVFCGLMGRLMYPINVKDTFGIVTCNVGVSNTSKSTMIDVILGIIGKSNIKTLQSKNTDFCLEGLDMANLIYDGEAENLPNKLSIDDFKKIAKGEEVSINGKNKTAKTTTIKCHFATCSNALIDYKDKSDAIRNRLINFIHGNIITPDTTVKNKIIASAPELLVYLNKMYIKLYNKGDLILTEQVLEWADNIKEEQNVFKSWLNMLNEDLYIQVKPSEGKSVKAKDLTDAWNKHCKFGLNNGKATKIGINEDAYLKTLGITTEIKKFCMHCECEPKKLPERCCEKYDNSKRKPLKMYIGCELVDGGKRGNCNPPNRIISLAHLTNSCSSTCSSMDEDNLIEINNKTYYFDCDDGRKVFEISGGKKGVCVGTY